MRKTVSTLALLALFALPLTAADLPVETDPTVDLEIAETVQTETETEAAGFDLEAVLDDGRIVMSCNFYQCYQSCLAQYGEGVQSSCEGWDRFNQTCVCYP
jgi:hypothetical protein